ncbi:hypothetical protein H2201_003212 [Coniosporium apollinis]|uniref:J domain-containing protein n=2 Tax=Coniosporium TaxID=2810619 RepID=A0ABQ9NVX5_9PEZI|nr:hypothetical protein H2199_008740 [Cladosporium sp. JES 115]KAJ9666555.1 hypothetical protein H2201_003212 [Coniosporium apollinis]
MSLEDLSDEPPSSINPYETLGLDKSATADQVKTAYRKAALKHHPDKASESNKAAAHTKFQEIAFAYAILSDPRRRSRYDSTGRTEESLDLEGDDFSWTDFFRAQFENVVSEEAINNFKAEYQGGDEERTHLLAAYTAGKGNMTQVYQQVMLSNPADDDARFRTIINQAIKDGEVEPYKKFTEESDASIKRRIKAAKKEAKEAEAYGEELKQKKGKGAKKAANGEASLAALIQQRQKGRAENFLDDLEAKYAPQVAKKGRKRAAPGDEPSEEAFEKTAERARKIRAKRSG